MTGFGWLRGIQKAIVKNTARVAVALMGTTSAATAAASRSNAWKTWTARAAPGEEEPEEEGDNSLESMAKEIEDEQATKLVKPIISYEDVENSFQATYVDTFEGMRMIVQKQVNMNTAVSHFYWIGSSQVPPYYHYTLTLVDQLSGAHCRAQTQDFTSVTGALGAKINDKIEVSSDYGLTEKGNTYTATMNLKGLGDSRSHISLQNAFDPSYAGAMFSAAFMQNVSKTLSFGGQSMFIAHQGVLVNSFAGIYDDGENCFAVQQGGAVSGVGCHAIRVLVLCFELCLYSPTHMCDVPCAQHRKAYGISLSSDYWRLWSEGYATSTTRTPAAFYAGSVCAALHSL